MNKEESAKLQQEIKKIKCKNEKMKDELGYLYDKFSPEARFYSHRHYDGRAQIFQIYMPIGERELLEMKNNPTLARKIITHFALRATSNFINGTCMEY